MSYCPVHPNGQKREHYSYDRNQPKNQLEYVLQPFPETSENYTYANNQPKNQEQIIVNPIGNSYTYGYPYAMYKRRQENNKEGDYSGVF